MFYKESCKHEHNCKKHAAKIFSFNLKYIPRDQLIKFFALKCRFRLKFVTVCIIKALTL